MVVTNVAVVKPRSADEVANTLREAAATRKAVTPVGGGRAATMGGLLARCDVELHMTALDRVVEHTAADMVVTVERNPVSSSRSTRSTRQDTLSEGCSPAGGQGPCECATDPHATS